jgi:hypothetical protein
MTSILSRAIAAVRGEPAAVSAPVRLVADGEELLLSDGEAFSIQARVNAAEPAVAPKVAPPAATRIAVRYLGFHDVEGRREYELDAQRGDQRGRYTVSIELAAFSRRQALLQEGPDICYQKLLRELSGSGLEGPGGLEVTEADLVAYRETHPQLVRRGTSATRPPEPAKPSDALPR